MLALALLGQEVAGAQEGAGDADTNDDVTPQRREIRITGTPQLISSDGVLDVRGRGRFVDTLELRLSGSSGLLINDLTMDDYIAGIAEMPTRWPMEALKAQAVAARTYAWRSIQRATFSGYDICATVACQVFRGAEVVLGSATGPRWRDAVNATSGEVLIDDEGSPILARYFSTSGGRTYANEEVFPSDGEFPYLTRIDDPFDAASPLHRWSVTFTREQFDLILERGTTLGAVVPVASVERLGAVDDPLAQVRVTGVNGGSAQVGAVAFRDFVSRVSASLFPDEFPGLRADGEQRLPATMPSSRFDVVLLEDEVVVEGQGWGHGVGMGQYGALGRAEDGHTYDEILAAYYAGLRPAVPDNLPERVRVGMTVPLPMIVGADGLFDILENSDTVVASTLGAWEIDRDGADWVLTAPVGHDDELAMSTTARVAGVPLMRDAIIVEATVNKPVFLQLRVQDGDGRHVVERDLGVVEAGVHAVTWRFDNHDRQRVEPGTYDVALVGVDRVGDERGTGMAVTVPEPPRPVRPQPEDDDQPDAAQDRPLTVPVALALGVGALGVALIAGSMLARRRR